MKAILGPAGKIRVLVDKIVKFFPHIMMEDSSTAASEEKVKVKDKREKESTKNCEVLCKESVLRTSTSQLDLISITTIQPAPGERGHERLPL